MKNLSFAFTALFLAACAGPATKPAGPVTTYEGQRQLIVLTSFLEGTWDTLPGAVAPIKLRMVEIWKGRPEERWVYAEYEKGGEPGQPFRQRVYRFTEAAGGLLGGDVYGLPEGGARFAGEWRKAKPFEGLSPSQLRTLENCRLKVARVHESIFAGGTEGNRCRGDRPEVAYERSEFHLSSSTLRNLEQGYDAAGKRVAGELQPYDLRKMSREPR